MDSRVLCHANLWNTHHQYIAHDVFQEELELLERPPEGEQDRPLDTIRVNFWEIGWRNPKTHIVRRKETVFFKKEKENSKAYLLGAVLTLKKKKRETL